MSPEQRDAPVEHSVRDTPFRLRADPTASTKLALIAKRARDEPKRKFSALMHHFSEANLEQCFHELGGRKARGADGVSKADYGKSLSQNVNDLVLRLKRFSYRPQPVRRVLIPKGGEYKLRPLGISCFEDKLVQLMAARILEAIFEQDFLECSFGFRPGRGCHAAIRSTHKYLYEQRDKARFVADVDIQSYFDSIDHQWLMRCLQERISDRKFLRLIERMLKAGVLTDDGLSKSVEGATQGSIVSPVLSNIYLHFILDLWFERVVKKRIRGSAELKRYADDSLAFFEYEQDAQMYIAELHRRMGKFGLKLHPRKTRLVCIDHKASRPGIVDFLGFTFYQGKSLKGHRTVKWRTSRKARTEKLKAFSVWLKASRNRMKLRDIWQLASTRQ